MNLTFASLWTPEGIVLAGALVTGLVAYVKVTFPALAARASGALLAFAATAILYVATGIAVPPATPDGWLTLFAAWLACGSASVGIHSTVKHVRRTRA